MKILLLNDNPVVNKLVTLSAQKTSDDLDVVDDIDNIVSDKYDLVIIDDTKYYNHLLKELKEKIKFNKSLYLHSRDSKGGSDFTKTLKKPFLPTDLVDLFLGFAKESNILEEEEELNLDELDLGSSDDEEISIDDLSENDDELSLDNWDLDKDNDELKFNDDTTLEDGLLDDIALFDDEDLADEELSDDDFSQSVLDKDEVNEVQGLLEDTDSDFDEGEFNFEDSEDSKEELNDLNENSNDEELGALDNLDDEDLDKFLGEDIETVEDNSDDSAIKESELESFEDDLTQDNENTIELSSDFTSDMDFEDEIQNEVDKLSEEDLQSEVDEGILPDIIESGIDEIDSLTSRDLKLAIGEEIDDIAEISQEEEPIEEDNETKIDETKLLEKNDSQDDGVESMKKLLNALLDKDIVASMKDMKIEIKITLGGK